MSRTADIAIAYMKSLGAPGTVVESQRNNDVHVQCSHGEDLILQEELGRSEAEIRALIDQWRAKNITVAH